MDSIRLYSLATPNGQKVSIALEEMELPYVPILIDITRGEQFDPEYMKINPNAKIPTIVDPQGPDGRPIAIMVSGAILIYLAEKSGRFLPVDARLRSETLQWLFFQIGGVGPMFGQFGHFFRFAPGDHTYEIERYTTESRRLLAVLETRLIAREFLVGERYTIADMATVPWVHALRGEFYQAEKQLGLSDFENVFRWVDRVLARPKTRTGMKVNELTPREKPSSVPEASSP